MNFCICASGNLGAIVLQQLVDKKIDIPLVLTDSKSLSVISICEENGIPFFKGNPRNGRFMEWFHAHPCCIDNLLSVNYLFILEEDVLSLVSHYSINFHGSLLPKYRGRTPHVWAIINGEKETGITAHFMNGACDDGDIVSQKVLPISDDETGAQVLERFNALYPSFVFEVIASIEGGCVQRKKQDVSKATYFSKRTSEDGLINWEWQKERIKNWVRAQAYPYPGAFAFYGKNKIVINKVAYTDYGFVDTVVNGTILSIIDGKPVVKTPNGTLLIENFTPHVLFNVGECFDNQCVERIVGQNLLTILIALCLNM